MRLSADRRTHRREPPANSAAGGSGVGRVGNSEEFVVCVAARTLGRETEWKHTHNQEADPYGTEKGSDIV